MQGDAIDKNKAIFIDQDCIINTDQNCLYNSEKIEFAEGEYEHLTHTQLKIFQAIQSDQ